MAQEWCLAYGVMEERDAEKAYKAMIKRKGKAAASGGGGSSSRSPPPKSSSSSKKKSGKKSKKRVLDDVEFDAGMDAGGGEGIGVAGL
eukprot:CAMPEP_0183733256 /NCGR_PEP_ID=MMETSP0737-20130205/40639_1 /TAXON_ID=385413 /ORGANISM="Thalassiosira miniscula, Strain CCMP1093" /LENGTH=87 /DNA_ID=CAMNT_0025966473 /DNA_START=167 /DNA_END=430 /DNA_ORIENTATION=+